MHIESWLFWLGLEIIFMLLAIIIFLMIAWFRSTRRHRHDTRQLLQKIHSLSTLSTQNSQPDKQLKACEAEIDNLKKQLEHERNNPFLKEKIDALIAENEDLQDEIDNLK